MSNDPLYTAHELDAVKELEIGEGFQLFIGRVVAELERRRRELEQALSPEATANCRGKIEALRLVISLTGILRNEIEADIKAAEKEESNGR